VKNGGEALVVDPKMSVYARRLKRWIERDLQAKVTTIIDTHYHFDHTRGNKLYPGARIIAHRSVPEAMRARDAAIGVCAGVPQPDRSISLTLLRSREIGISWSGARSGSGCVKADNSTSLLRRFATLELCLLRHQ
jgi:hypothetical protein